MDDGIFGMSVSPRRVTFNNFDSLFNGPNERVLYFHAFASDQEAAVPLKILNDPSLFVDPNSQANAFKAIGSRGNQTAAEAMDSNGNLFFVLFNPIALACWDSSTPYSVENIKIVQQNDTTLQFASGLKVVKNLFGVEEIWIMTIRYQVT